MGWQIRREFPQSFAQLPDGPGGIASLHVDKGDRDVNKRLQKEPPRPMLRSPFLFKNFMALNPPGTIQRYKTASIGPITSETLRMHGIEPTVEATPHTTEGVIDAILAYHHTQS